MNANKIIGKLNLKIAEKKKEIAECNAKIEKAENAAEKDFWKVLKKFAIEDLEALYANQLRFLAK